MNVLKCLLRWKHSQVVLWWCLPCSQPVKSLVVEVEAGNGKLKTRKVGLWLLAGPEGHTPRGCMAVEHWDRWKTFSSQLCSSFKLCA